MAEELLNTTPAEPTDGTPTESGDEWDIAFDEAEEEDPAPGTVEENSENGNGKPEARTAAGTGASTDPEETKGAIGAEELFELKHLGEVKKVSKSEVVALAQKGMDYDHVKGEYVQLKETAAGLEALAKESGFASVKEMLDQAKENIRQAKIQSMVSGKGYTEEQAKAALETEERAAALDQREAQLNAAEQTAQSETKEREAMEQRRKADISEFVKEYPDIKPADIPKEVWAQVAKGASLLTAYMRHENKRLQAELSASRQDRENRQRTPGSVSSAGVSTDSDPFLAALSED